jgi:hypothetical protein
MSYNGKDPWIDFDRWRQENEFRTMLYKNRVDLSESLQPIISTLFADGKIDTDEYSKYILDETGTYIPKTKKNEL